MKARSSTSADQKVAIVYHFFAHYREGVIRELLNQSTNEYILVGDRQGREGIKAMEIADDARFVYTPTSYFGSIVYYQAGLIRLALRRDIRAIIYLGNAAWPTTWISAALARVTGKRVLFWTHGWTKTDGWFKSWYRRTFYRIAHGLLLYGHAAKMTGIAQGFGAERLHVIYNSLDYNAQKAARAAVTPKRIAELRKSLFGEASLPILICTSRLTSVRRLDLLLEAMARLKASGRPLHLLLVGDGPEQAALRRLAAKLGLSVCFYGPCYDERVLAELLMAATVTVAPGKVGLTAMQSLAFGVPVITHNDPNDQMPEWEAIIPGRTGDYFNRGDVEDLARVIERWTRSPGVKAEVEKACIDIVERLYNPETQRQLIDRAVDGYPANDLISTNASSPVRPSVAIVSNGVTPYGINVCMRIARELPEIQLWTVFTHQYSMGVWPLKLPTEIGPVMMGKGEHSTQQSNPLFAWHEWRKGGQVNEWISTQDIKLVVVFGYNDLGRLRLIRWCRRHGVPCFVWGDSNIRGDISSGLKAAAKRFLLTGILSKCTGALACGRYGKAYFEKYGVSPKRIFLFPNEPDYSLFRTPPTEAISSVKERFKLTEERRRIVFSGRLVQVKRVDLAIAAFAAIAEMRPEWDLVIVGDGPLRDELRMKVPAQIRDRVLWTDFLADQTSMAAIYRLCDVLVLPSDFEPWALVVNEAVAAGLSVVASDIVGAAVELVRDGVNGRLFPPGDLAALIECLEYVTDENRTETLKRASPEVLVEWSQRADPVQGLRGALKFSGLLEN